MYDKFLRDKLSKILQKVFIGDEFWNAALFRTESRTYQTLNFRLKKQTYITCANFSLYSMLCDKNNIITTDDVGGQKRNAQIIKA